jgi:hypothetical protein
LKLASSLRHKTRGKIEFIRIYPLSSCLFLLRHLGICQMEDICVQQSHGKNDFGFIWFSYILMMAGNDHGLMNLYKDMESCGEYTDIQVMWKMVHSCHPIAQNTRRKRPCRNFCFRPIWILSILQTINLMQQ